MAGTLQRDGITGSAGEEIRLAVGELPLLASSTLVAFRPEETDASASGLAERL